jgi:hypothetical protein
MKADKNSAFSVLDFESNSLPSSIMENITVLLDTEGEAPEIIVNIQRKIITIKHFIQIF